MRWRKVRLGSICASAVSPGSCGTRDTGGVKQIGRRSRRGGVGISRTRAKRIRPQAIRQGVLSTLPSLFSARVFRSTSISCARDTRAGSGDCALAQAGQSHLFQHISLERRQKVCLSLESPENTAHHAPDASAETPPAAPHEPILTLPPALTAYVLLLAIIHLRVLLPPDWEEWSVEVFGFIPKRYDTTLLDVTFPGGAGAKVWSFVTYSLLHANLSHIVFNVLWLLPFGSALARRFGAVRFFA